MSTSFFGPPSSRFANNRPKIGGPPTNGLFDSPFPNTKPSTPGVIASNVSSNRSNYAGPQQKRNSEPTVSTGIATRLFAGTVIPEAPKETTDNRLSQPKSPLSVAKGNIRKLNEDSKSLSHAWKYQSVQLLMEHEGGKQAVNQAHPTMSPVDRQNVPASLNKNIYEDQAVKECGTLKAALEQKINHLEVTRQLIMQELEVARQERLQAQTDREEAHRDRQEANAYLNEVWNLKCYVSKQAEDVSVKEKRLDLIIKEKMAEREKQLVLMMTDKITSLEEQIAIQQKKIALQEIEWRNNVEDKVAKLVEEYKQRLNAENEVQLSSAVAQCKQMMNQRVSESSSRQDRYKEKTMRIINRDAQKLVNKVAGQLVELETRIEELENCIKQSQGDACKYNETEDDEAHTRDTVEYSAGLASVDMEDEAKSKTAAARKVLSDSVVGSAGLNAVTNLPPLSASADNQPASLDTSKEVPTSKVYFPVVQGKYNHVTHSLLLKGSKEPIKCHVPTLCFSPATRGPIVIPDRSWIKGCHKIKAKGSVTDRVRTDVIVNAILARNSVVSSKRPGLGEMDEKEEYAEAVDKAEMRTLSFQLRKIKFGKKHGCQVTFKDEPEICIIPNRAQIKEMEESALREETSQEKSVVTDTEDIAASTSKGNISRSAAPQVEDEEEEEDDDL